MDHVQNAGDGSRQKRPPSGQQARDDHSDADDEIYHEASESRSVRTKTWDGDGPLEIHRKGTNHNAEPLSRPGTGSSDMLLFDHADEDELVISRCVVKPASDSLELPDFNGIHKPESPAPLEAQDGFKMSAALPRKPNITQQNQKPEQRQQLLPSSVPDSGFYSAPGKAAGHGLAQVQQDLTSPSPYSSSQLTTAQVAKSPVNHVETHSSNSGQSFGTTGRVVKKHVTDDVGMPANLLQKLVLDGVTTESNINETRPAFNEARTSRTKRQGQKHVSCLNSARKKKNRERKARVVYNLDDIEDPINISGTCVIPTADLHKSEEAPSRIPYAQPAPTIETCPEQKSPNLVAQTRAVESTISTVQPSELAARTRQAQTVVEHGDISIPGKSDSDNKAQYGDDMRGNNVTLQKRGFGQPQIPTGISRDADYAINEPIPVPAPAQATSIQPRSVSPQPMSSESQHHRVKSTMAKDPLRFVSHRAGSAKIIKSKSERTNRQASGLAALAACAEQGVAIERLHEVWTDRNHIIEGLVQELGVSESELHDSRKVNEGLTNQLEESRARQTNLQAQVQKFSATASRLKKFMTGLGNDMTSLGKIRGEIDTVITENRSLQDVRHQQQLVERKVHDLRKETLFTVDILIKEKEQLQERLSEKAGQLSEERDLSAVLQRQLDKPTADYAKMQQLLEELNDKTIVKINALHEIANNRKKDDELLEIVRKCSEETESLGRQAQSATERSGELKTLVESLSSVTQTHLENAKKAAAEEPDHVLTVEARIVALLEGIKTDIRSQDDLAAEGASLRESIVTLKERLEASGARVHDLNSQAVVYQSRETSLKERITQLEASNASLQNECLSSEGLQARLEQAQSTHSVMRQEVEKMKAEEVTHAFKLGSLCTKAEESRQEKENLQRRLVEMEDQLAEARQIVPNFEPERRRLQEEAARDLREYKLTVSKQAQANYSKHSGEMRQAQKLKEVAEKQLAIITSELEPVKAENQLLKEQAKDKSANDRSKAQAAELEAVATQRRQLHIEAAAYRETIQTLQDHLTECQAAQHQGEKEVQKICEKLQRLQQDYQNTQKHMVEIELSKKGIEERLEEAEGRARRVEAASRDQAERHESELLNARSTIEEERSCRKATEDLYARLQESVDAQARFHQNHHDVAVQTEDTQVQCADTSQNSESFGSAPTSQDLTRLDEPPQQQSSNTRPRKGLKKIDRNLNVNFQPSQRRQAASAPRSEDIPESEQEIPETQLSEDDMLDNRNPNSQGSNASGFDLSAISNQILDANGVREVGNQNSQRIEEIQPQSQAVGPTHGVGAMRLPGSAEDTQPKAKPFSRLNAGIDMETQSHSSSPSSSSQSSYSNFAQIVAEESQSNLRLAKPGSQKSLDRMGSIDEQPLVQAGPQAMMRPTQGTDMSAPPHRSGSISQGIKRDPQQHTQAKASMKNMPLTSKPISNPARSQRESQRSSSPAFMNVELQPKPASSRNKQASKSSAPESWDIYDFDSSPIVQGKKRPHASAESGLSKKARPSPGPATPRPGSQHSRKASQSGSTTKGTSSLTHHTTMVKQTKTVRSSSNISGSSHRARSSKQNPKFAERFNQL